MIQGANWGGKGNRNVEQKWEELQAVSKISNQVLENTGCPLICRLMGKMVAR